MTETTDTTQTNRTKKIIGIIIAAIVGVVAIASIFVPAFREYATETIKLLLVVLTGILN